MFINLEVAVINARVYTMEPGLGTKEAVGVADGKIALVGSTREIIALTDAHTKVIDAQGKAVLPGFNDAHSHFSAMGVRESYLDLTTVQSKAEALTQVKEAARLRNKGEWIIGTGWDESKWEDSAEYLTRDELDRAVPDHPVALRRIDGHLWSVNSKALDVLSLPTQAVGYETLDGEPTGVLKEQAGEAVEKALEPGVDEFIAGIERAVRIAHRLGVTSVQDAMVGRKQITAYRKLHASGRLGVRVAVMPTVDHLDEMIGLGLGVGFGDDTLRLGAVKVFADGSIGAGTAALNGTYRDRPHERGVLMWKKEELEAIVRRACENNVQLAVHAIGDRALDQVLDCFAAANADAKVELRHRIEHAEMITAEQIERMKRLGLVASMQPNFTGEWGLPGGMYEQRFGREMLERLNTLRSVVDAGVHLALGSDCMPFSPLYGIHWAVNAPFPQQRLTPGEAITAYTKGSAYATFEEHRKGTIATGQLADLVVLDGDPFVETSDIKDISVQYTIFAGKIVYKRG